MSGDSWIIRPVAEADRAAWALLFTDYCAFYGRTASDAQLDRVWSWIRQTGEVSALVAAPSEDPTKLMAIAHLRPWVRPLRGEVAGYLDDLFVAPSARGSGVFEELMSAIGKLGRDEGWRVVRWTTAVDNHRARSAYDRVAQRTDWVTYDMDLLPEE
jgi:GNAT superfamily N-acetyltransferase